MAVDAESSERKVRFLLAWLDELPSIIISQDRLMLRGLYQELF